MSEWRLDRPETDLDPDADLREADELLLKADALLRKHTRAQSLDDSPEDSPDQPVPTLALEDDDDLPILTEIVKDYAGPAAESSPLADTERAPVELAEYLVGLDTELAREIESWFATELPQLVAREFDLLNERLRTEALAHMRATLVPALSELIAARLDGLDRKPPKSR